MKGKLLSYIRYLVLSLLHAAGLGSVIFSQTPISGIINEYARVDAIGVDNVVVNDEVQFQQFAPGDTVLLIQMKGLRIDSRESNAFGDIVYQYGQAGAHEFLTVLSVDDPTNTIVFRNNLRTSFDVMGRVQIVKVPSFNRAIVKGTLTCQAWDSTSRTGGVLVALDGNIDVTGKGFKGGLTATGLGICSEVPHFYNYSYSALSDSAGFKGEGLANEADTTLYGTPPFFPIYPDYAKGKGKNFNGGGGGDGKFSGGGGGSNYGAGGRGDSEKPDCSPSNTGGLGGNQISGTAIDGGLFLGGGGGASTYLTGGTPSAGGDGGGIVILVCDEIKGKGHNILADGGSVTTTADGNAGAGGGGGGGSVAIYLQSFSSPLDSSAITISAKGGTGGNNSSVNNFGAGGGGGGGYIDISTITNPGNVISTVAAGPAGTRPGGTNANSGSPGKIDNTFLPVLNGFLFNSIRSSGSQNQVDTVCSNVIPNTITGTTPAGGSGDYTFIWEKSYNLAGPPSTISGASSKDYSPAATEANTFWVRRIVVDDNTSLTDTSKWVNIIVQTAISGNIVGKDTTVCEYQDPLDLIPLNSGPSNGNGHYSYQWLQNIDNNWPASSNAGGSDSTLPYFDPPALGVTTYYKRLVTSGACIDYSNTVTITVLSSISGNVINQSDSVICEGSLFTTLGASAAGGAAGTYTYQWQDSTIAGSWLPASGVNTNTTLDPDTSDFNTVENRYFRRVVFSGPDSVCRSKSQPILLTRYHKIKNNVISKDTTVCSTVEDPAPLTGSTPIQGRSGAYIYQWQDSIKGGSWTDLTNIETPYDPPPLTDTTWYRRTVISSVCYDTSNIVVINVHKPLTGYNIEPDTTICNGSVPDLLRGQTPGGGDGTSYTFQWSDSTAGLEYADISFSGSLKDYQPPSLTESTWYKRKLTSGKCTIESNSIKVTVLPSISGNNIAPDTSAVCFNTVPGEFTDDMLSGGAGSGSYFFQWQDSTEGNSWINAAGSSATDRLYTPVALDKKTWFRRIVISGPEDCCADTSSGVIIDTIPLPTGIIQTSADTVLCEGSDIKFRVNLTGSPPWNIHYLENSTDIQKDPVSAPDIWISRTPVLDPADNMKTFTYTLASVRDHNKCYATVLTGSRKGDVYRIPVADAGPETDEFCGPSGYELNAVSADFPGIWIYPAQVANTSAAASERTVVIDIDPAFTPPDVTYDFYWKEVNNVCKDSDLIRVTFYTPVTDALAGTDIDTMSYDHIVYLNAGAIQDYETGLWMVKTGAGDFSDATGNSTMVSNVASGSNTFIWKVTNGVCIMEDEINIIINEIVVPKGISPDNYEGGNNTLVIGGLDTSPDGRHIVELRILNGAGVQVFYTTNRNGQVWKEWDGTNSQGIKLPDGTYYYLLSILSKDYNEGKPMKMSGFIILKRQ